MMMLCYLMLIVMILLSVALFTLMERKILGYVHLRVGPNKNLLLGLWQPFNDLIKLFSKNEYKHSNMKVFLFLLSPLMMVFFSLCLWMFFQHWANLSMMKYLVLVIMSINGLVTFSFLFPGWGSGSTYSMMGGYRSSAQAISYEGIFFFCIIIYALMFSSFNMSFYNNLSYMFQNFITMFFILFPWMISILAESNRTPFDFSEGESELVSGFNTEYGSGMFSLIFLSEYMSMLFYSFFTSMIFCNNSSLMLYMFFFLLLMYVWIRTIFPRLRYDKLMKISWKSLMFFVTSMFIMYMFIIIY